MSWLFHPTGGPGDGLFPVTHRVNATNRTGAALNVGEGVQFDLVCGTDVDDLTPGSTDSTAGDNTSGFNNVIAPSAGAILGHTTMTILGFNGGRLGAPADNALADIIYFGMGKGLVIDASGSVAVGGDLTLVTDGNFDNVPVENEMIFARANEVVTTPTSATLCKLFFFGFMLGNWPLTTYLD